MKRRLTRGLSVLLALACVGLSAIAGPVGREFRVNNYTTGYQDNPAVAALNDGGFIVVWESAGHGSEEFSGIWGRRYDSAGKPVAGEFRVSSSIAYGKTTPSVAALNDGGFVVTWTSNGQDGSGYGVYGRRYDSTGTHVGGEFLVNSYIADNQDTPSVAGLSGGGFVVTWQSSGQDGDLRGVYARRYDSSGKHAGSEFRVNNFIAGDQWAPCVAGLSDGGFVVTWQSNDQDGSGYGVYGRRYDSAGKRVGGEFRVNRNTTDNQSSPSVTGLSGGGFVVAWQSNGQDGSGYGVYGLRYDSAGNRIGGEFRVNNFKTGNQAAPVIAGQSDGGFVVIWESQNQDLDGDGVYGRRYDSAGNRVGGEFRVNTYTASNQRQPAVAAFTGGFIVTWTSDGQDGSGYGVYGQRYDLP